MTTPRIYQTDIMNTDSRICRWTSVARTIKNRANENSGESGLFGKVYVVLDIWGVRTIGPQLFLRVGHDPNVHELGREGAGGLKRPSRIVERWRDRQQTGNSESLRSMWWTKEKGRATLSYSGISKWHLGNCPVYV